MVIYKTTNLINGKIYVGQDKNNNNLYLGSGTAIKRAIKKYGKENFRREILEECQNYKDLNDKEIYWINKLNSRDKNKGYNISKGGDEGNRSQHGSFYQCWIEKYGKDIADIKFDKMKNQIRETLKEKGTVFSKYGKNGVYKYWVEKYGVEEANIRLEKKKEKLRKIEEKKKLNGWHHTEQTKKIIGEYSKNRKFSDETKLKMSLSQKGVLHKGHKVSDETKEKIRNKAIGRKVSDETKEKIKKKLIGRYFGKNNVPIIINNIKYESAGKASKILNIKNSTINYRLNSKSKKFINYIYDK